MKLWDKGYDIDRFTEEFTIGKDRELDVMLAKADVLGNMAHLKMLHHIGLISDGELKDLAQGLKDIFAEIEQGKFHIEAGIEDIHSQIECLLTRKCGEAGKKIHTGRSRNDQVLTDLKLFTRTALIDVLQQVTSLFHLLMEKAEANKDILMPGYTHLQIAMPSSFGMWFSAYAESLADDLLMLKAAYDMVNTNPLGSGAGYGSSVPLNRTMTTRLLGFGDLAYNSVYAQMQRGKMEKNVLFALATVATTLGKLAADVCLFACGNFGFLRLPDRFTTGSSIMPHKKNPVLSENLCGLARVVRANSIVALENIPLWHERDISHSSAERIIFPDSLTLVDFMLSRFNGIVKNLVVHEKNMLKNTDKFGGIVFSQKVLLKLVEKGLTRENAYRLVQRNALDAFENDGDFRVNLLNDEDVTKLLTPVEIDEIFNKEEFLKNINTIYSKILDL